MKRLTYYIKIWLLMSKNAFLVWLSQKTLIFVFLTGKLLRFFFFLGFIYLITSGSKEVAGYNSNQIIFFFLTFNLIDVVAQFLFREVYRFRPLLISGDFDLILLKPVNALFRVLLGGADLLDLITIPVLVWGVIHFGGLIGPDVGQIYLFVLLMINSLLIAAAFYISVLALGIITLEIDHSVMIFRDLASLGRFPVDIYKEPLRGVITFLIPIGIMITFPAKALMGLLSPVGIVSSFVVGLGSMFIAVWFWNFAIKRYTSASS